MFINLLINLLIKYQICLIFNLNGIEDDTYIAVISIVFGTHRASGLPYKVLVLMLLILILLNGT